MTNRLKALEAFEKITRDLQAKYGAIFSCHLKESHLIRSALQENMEVCSAEQATTQLDSVPEFMGDVHICTATDKNKDGKWICYKCQSAQAVEDLEK